MSRYAPRHNKRDANEPELVRIAQQCGAIWVEAGPLDGWLWARIGRNPNAWTPVEIKNPKGFNRLQKGQVEFIAECDARGAPYYVWRQPEDVVRDLASFGER